MRLPKSLLIADQTIKISGSKSESNRLLILQKLLGNFEISNISNAQDTHLLQIALENHEDTIDVHHAGTAMRFLTSYLAIQEGQTTILTGSTRMKERPIRPLVEALRKLGANIEYLGQDGYPPLKIHGKNLSTNKVTIPAYISSQFITSLMMIGCKMNKGLNIKLLGHPTSIPYLEMTIALMKKVGLRVDYKHPNIHIEAKPTNTIDIPKITIESDWSSASYFYALAAIGRKPITLEYFRKNSLQGDAVLVNLYEYFFGVTTRFNKNESITLLPKKEFTPPSSIILNMNHCPDIVQTLCVTATAFKIPFKISGLETLKIKETDRLIALRNELAKLGAITEITNESIQLISFSPPQKQIKIHTYNDHRMAMSFAPYALVETLEIEDPKVVEKSYPNFWEDFFRITQPI